MGKVNYRILCAWLLYIFLVITFSLQGYFDFSICEDTFAPLKFVNDVYILEAGGFIITCCGCFFRMARIKHILKSNQSVMFTLLIILMSTLSSLLNLFGIGGLCRNRFGLTIPAVRWIQWLVCFPLLEVALIVIDGKEIFTLYQGFTITLQIVSLLCLVIIQTFVGYDMISYILISIASVSFIGSYYMFFKIMQKYEISFIHEQSQHSMDINNQISLRKLRHYQIFLWILPLFPILYILTITKLFDTNISILLYIIFNSMIFLFFTSSLINIHFEIAQLQITGDFNSNLSRRTFLRYVFHEVRVPLNSITLGIHLLNSSSGLNNEDKESLAMMREASLAMSHTLNDVLSIQRIEEGQVELILQPFLIKDFISDILSTYHIYISDKNAIIRTHVDVDVPPTVIGDKIKLEHIMGNLLANALKFSTKNCIINITVKLPVKSKVTDNSTRLLSAFVTNTKNIKEVMCTTTSNMLTSMGSNYRFGNSAVKKETIIFSVGDSGQGISEENLKTLFRPFAQLRPGELSMSRGSGIGLAICKELVVLHGGEITCESKPGVGSIFSVIIPFELPSPPPPPPNALTNSSTYHLNIQAGQNISDRSTVKLTNKEVRLEDGQIIDSDNFYLRNDKANYVEEQDYFYESEHNSRRPSMWIRLNDATASSSNNNINNTTTTTNGMTSVNSHHSFHSVDSGVGLNNIGTRDVLNEHGSGSGSISQHSWYQFPKPHSISPLDSQKSLFFNSYDVDSFNSSVSDDKLNVSTSSRFYPSNITTIVEDRKNNDEDDYDDEDNNNNNDNNNDYMIGEKCDYFYSRKKFLVVDDVLSNRKMLSLLLSKKGVDCDLAENGAIAVERVCANPTKYDLIFMDNMMPIMTGVVATKELRELGFKNLIIGLTGNALDDDVAVFIGAGADMVLAKPLKVEYLEQLLLFVDCQGAVSSKEMKLDSSHGRLRWVPRN